MTWKTFPLTSIASVIVAGTILLPDSELPVGSVVVKTPAGKPMLIPAGIRVDPGEGAAVPGDLLAKLGGGQVDVEVRPATRFDVLKYKPSVLFQLFIAVLALVGTVLTAISAILSTDDPKTPTFTVQAAPWVLGITCVLAAGKLWTDVSGAIKL